MVSPKYARLLADLKDATASGKVRWEKTAEETMFRTALGRGMLRIDKSIPDATDSAEAGPVYLLFLLADDATVVDTVEIPAEDPVSAVAAQLYDLARRSAGDVDELLDSMLRDLGARAARRA